MDYRADIMDFFIKKKRSDGLGFDTDLFAGGFTDSLFALEIIVYLEEEFDLRIEDSDITQENFKTINNMASLVERIKGA